VHQSTSAVGLLSGLRDLLLPVTCAGCRREAAGLVCGDCVAALAALTPHPVRPDPPPPDLPPCHAAGRYGGRLRELILGYKDRGRHALAGPLADSVVSVLSVAVPHPRPVLLVPVPTTGKAIRERRGDHMLRLARAAARRLRRGGRTVAVARPVRARGRPDSAGLSAADRVRLAQASVVPRPLWWAGWRPRQVRRLLVPVPAGAQLPAVVVLDDVITTGATVTAVCEVLAGMGLPVDSVVVLAATERRRRPASGGTWWGDPTLPTPGDGRARED
jgi:predicted amidophosphoribosyltransferase